jgi:hypothetical protein
MTFGSAGLFAQSPYSNVADAEKDGWIFVWGDEFDGTQIDPSKWTLETGETINNEAQPTPPKIKMHAWKTGILLSKRTKKNTPRRTVELQITLPLV